jgi:hypothetical protein
LAVRQLLNLPTIALVLLMGPFFISMGKQTEADEVLALALVPVWSAERLKHIDVEVFLRIRTARLAILRGVQRAPQQRPVMKTLDEKHQRFLSGS